MCKTCVVCAEEAYEKTALGEDVCAGCTRFCEKCRDRYIDTDMENISYVIVNGKEMRLCIKCQKKL